MVWVRRKAAGSELVVAHEFTHALTVNAINNPTAEQKPTIDKLQKLYEHVKNQLDPTGKKLYGLRNLKEFVAEANSNVSFQYQLAKIKYKNETAWGAFTKLIANLLGIANVSALTEVIALTEELASTDMTTGKVSADITPEAIFFNRKKPPQAPQRTSAGQQAMNTMGQMNRQVTPPPPNFLQKVHSVYTSATQNPQLTAQTAKAATKRFIDKIETVVFSSDAALNNQIRRNIMASMAGMDVKIGQLLEVSLSQTMHADAMATLHMMEGKIVYDNKLHKWVARSEEHTSELQSH